MTWLAFEPCDTWVFRETRPMDAVGGAELSSSFPPPAATVAGALRAHLGESLNIPWDRNPKRGRVMKRNREWRETRYRADELGRMHMQGPYVSYGGRRWFPAPA